MLARRSFISGLVSAPAIVAAASLMPLRGVKMVFPELSIDPATMAALLDARLDVGNYPGDGLYVRYQGIDDVEVKLGLCSKPEYAARRQAYDRACIAFIKGEGPYPGTMLGLPSTGFKVI